MNLKIAFSVLSFFRLKSERDPMKNKNIAVVLVEPQGPINIGAVCRTMMNFGISDLRLVNPCPDYLGEDARKMALSALPLLTNARTFDTLAAAIQDCGTSFGTTRRFGRYRKDFLFPEQCGEKAVELSGSNRCALVFGREDSGLYTEELELCQHFVTIPTDEAFASMNLSHAVCLCLYEVSRAMRKNSCPGPKTKPLASSGELEQMLQHMRRTFLDIDYLDPQNPDHLLRTFRRIFGRAGLRERDIRIIRGLLSRMDWTEQERRKLLSAKTE